MFLSAVMMLEHVGEVEKAHRIRQAIAEVVVREGVCAHLCRHDAAFPAGQKAISQERGQHKSKMTDAVLAKLQKQDSHDSAECELVGSARQHLVIASEILDEVNYCASIRVIARVANAREVKSFNDSCTITGEIGDL